MRMVGFSTPERRNMTVYQQVRRRAQRVVIVEVKKDGKPVKEVNIGTGQSDLSSLTEEIANSLETAQNVRRRILESPTDDLESNNTSTTPSSNTDSFQYRHQEEQKIITRSAENKCRVWKTEGKKQASDEICYSID
jgi:hypothetical protein